MDSVYVILVNFNNSKMTKDCIESIKKSSYKNYSIVVVDNASCDDSYDSLSLLFGNSENIYILRAVENNGFSAGNNIGINFALNRGADYIMLLNNDTVIDENMIQLLHSKATEKTVTTPKMYYYSRPNVIWYAGGELEYKYGGARHLGLDKEDSETFSLVKSCTFVTGCCVMIHRNILEKVGLLDETYFMYGEDVDYSIRLQEEGIEILFVPTAKLWHKVGGSGTSKINIYYDTRNKLYIMDKYGFPKISKVRYRVKILLLYIRGILKKNNDTFFRKAYLDYRRGVKGRTNL